MSSENRKINVSKCHWRQPGSLKERCKELGVNYWRAQKRREAGMSDEQVFDPCYRRGLRKGSPVTVGGVTYANLQAAVRQCNPVAHAQTIARWMTKGMSADEAFSRLPNPGYRQGVIYLIWHEETGMGYVGLSVRRPELRFADHLVAAVAGAIKSEHSLHAAIRQYGPENFLVVIIDEGTSLKDLGEKERKHILEHGTLAPKGFNISPGGTTGGSTPKPRTLNGVRYSSTGKLIEYVAADKGISVAAAAKRVHTGRIDVKAPPKAGQGSCKTPAYKSWSSIVHGQANPASKSFKPGLTICERWRDFHAFLEDVGQPPSKGMAFSRLDKALGFFKDNCRWMTKSEASRINAAFMKKNGTLVGNRRRSE